MSGGPCRRNSRAFTLRTKPVNSGASSSTSSICAPWTARSRIRTISPSTKSRNDERAEHERQELADGQELQAIEPVGGEADAGGDRRIERFPDQVVQLDRRAAPAGCRRAAASRHARGRETRRCRRRGGSAGRSSSPCIASPGWRRDSRNPRPARGAAGPRRSDGSPTAASVPDIDHEQKDQQAVIGAAARGDRDDRKPLRAASAPACARRSAAGLTGASASMNSAGQDSGEQAQRRQQATSRRARTESVSVAASAAGVRGRPRNVTP